MSLICTHSSGSLNYQIHYNILLSIYYILLPIIILSNLFNIYDILLLNKLRWRCHTIRPFYNSNNNSTIIYCCTTGVFIIIIFVVKYH